MRLFELDQIPHTQSMMAKTHTPVSKRRLKHSTLEFQSIQQFWLQLDIVS